MSLAATLKDRWQQPQGYREILRVGLPLMAGAASSTVMQFTDRFFLSRYSVDAIAAALPASLASLTILLTFMGLCSYSTVLIAQYVGARAFKRIGSAMWQGLWCTGFCSIVLVACWWIARPLFTWIGHEPHLQELEIIYFQVVTAGSGFALLQSAFAAFFAGRSRTRPVMIANIAGATLNVPLDYLFIFGGFGIPSMGVFGAALATVIGWIFGAAILGILIFTRRNEKRYKVRSGWPFEKDMFKRLLRYGLPSGGNLFLELIGVTWFAMIIGQFGTVALAASNIAFSINSLVFTPTLGLNMAVATLVGQAMGRRRPDQAERVALNALPMGAGYMLPVAFFIAIFAPQLMDIFKPNDMTALEFVPVRELGIILLYFIVIYSTIDCANIIYFGALKGAGDTMGVLMIMSGGLVACLIVPIYVLRYLDMDTVYSLWICFTVYVMALAVAAFTRFYRRGWHKNRIIEEEPILPAS